MHNIGYMPITAQTARSAKHNANHAMLKWQNRNSPRKEPEAKHKEKTQAVIKGTRCLWIGRVGLLKAFVSVCYKMHMGRKVL